MSQLNVAITDEAREVILKQSDKIAVRMALGIGC